MLAHRDEESGVLARCSTRAVFDPDEVDWLRGEVEQRAALPDS